MIKSYKKFFYGVLLSLLFVNLYTSYATYSSDSFTESDVEAILTYFNLTHDSATVAGYQSQINQVRSANNLNKMNVVFCLMDQVLYMVPSNGTVGNSESHLALFSSAGNVYLRQFDHFSYSGEEITSATYTLIPTSYLITRYGNQTKSNWQYNWSYSQYIIGGANSQYVNFPYVLATFPTHTVASWVNTGQYDWRFLYNYIELDGWTPPVLPTPIPTETPTPTPSGGGSVDLTNVEIGIADIKDNIHNLNVDMNRQANEIKNKIPTSGDIQNATVGAMTDYWGSSGDLDGENQEDEIENNINNLIDNVSGELTQNEAYNQLNEIENGFLNFFDQNHDEEWYDLIIKWDNIDLNISKRRYKPSRKLFYTEWRN